MKEIGLTIIIVIIYCIIWKAAGFESAVIAGISQIIGQLTFKK